MDDRKTEIIARLRSAAGETTAFFAALSPQEQRTSVYTAEVQWTARQVLAHLVTIEKSMQSLFGNILAGGPGSPRDFDIRRFNRSQPQKLDPLSMTELVARFEAVRADTIALVAAMAEDDLDREGYHVFLGQGRLEQFIRWAYEHARRHEVDVAEALERSKG